MTYEDHLRDAFAAKAAELADRARASQSFISVTEDAAPVELPGHSAWYRSTPIRTWTITAMAAAAALVAAVLLIGNSSPERVSTGPDFAATSTTAVPAASPTVAPAAAPTSVPDPTAAASSPEPAQEPTAAPEPTPADQVLLPGPDWNVDDFYADVQPPYDGDVLLPSYASRDGDLFGQVLYAYNLPDADYRRVGNPGGPYYDLVTPDGRTVRVRTDSAPEVLLAVVDNPPGSYVVISYDLNEDELVAAIDSVRIDGVRLGLGTDLPAGLKPMTPGRSQWTLSTYNLSRGEGETLTVVVMDPDLWQLALLQREMHPDAEMIKGEGFSGIIYESDGNDDAGAVLVTEDAILIIRLPRWSPTSAPTPIEEIRAIVSGFEFRETDPIYDGLGLQSRRDMYQDWIAETPLPADADLTWTFDGPPVNAIQEASLAHQIFGCAWVEQWVTTGDASALDELVDSGNWPTAELNPEATGLYSFSVEDARTLVDADARMRSSLALDCSWLLGAVPAD